MRKEFVIGFLVMLMTLILIGILGEPIGAVLGGIAFLSVTVIVVLVSHVVHVHQRTVLVVQSPLHSAVRRVVAGPATTFLFPFLEEAGTVMDTGDRLEEVHVTDILQSDQRPATVSFTAQVMYKLAPNILSPSQLGEILPHLTDNPSGVVQRWTDYYLRILVADTDLTRIHNRSRSRLEYRLEQLLRERMAKLGIVILDVQVVVWPPAGLQDALTNAEEQRVGTTLQAERLAAILGALTGQSEEARSLAILELANALGRTGQTWTSVDLASLLSSISVDSDQTSLSAPAQLPPLQDLLKRVPRS